MKDQPRDLIVIFGALHLTTADMTTLRTVGHGTLAAEAFASLLDKADIEHVVDVRSFPGSRHNPQFGREEMERWLPDSGHGYAWMRELGGRRRPIGGIKARCATQ